MNYSSGALGVSHKDAEKLLFNGVKNKITKKKSWDLIDGRHAYKNKKGVFVDPEIAELKRYWDIKEKKLKRR
jgi:hypothetical protein